MDYKTVFSNRKTICLKIHHDGSIEVRAPYGTSRAFIDRFVTSHEKWVDKKRDRLLQKQSAMQQVDIERLRAMALEYIPVRAEYYAKVMGVRYTGLKITAAKSRFGSCNSKNSICFSLYLMSYPESAIDYVIVHELAHIKEKNHSSAFYKVVESVLPDYKDRRKLLKNGVL